MKALVDPAFDVPYPSRAPRRVGRVSRHIMIAAAQREVARRLADPNVSEAFMRMEAAARRKGCTLAFNRRFQRWYTIPLDPDSEYIERAAENLESERHEDYAEIDYASDGMFSED